MIRVNRLGDLALDLEARQERLEEPRAADSLRLADGERGDERRHGRVRQQAEDSVRAGRELRVVPVEGVAAGAVDERGRGRAGLERLRTEHRGGRTRIGALHVLVENAARVLRRAREHDAQAVDDAAFADRDGVFGEVGEPRVLDEVDDCAGRRFGCCHRAASIAAGCYRSQNGS